MPPNRSRAPSPPTPLRSTQPPRSTQPQRSAVTAVTTDEQEKDEQKKKALTLNQVLAGAGASATSAVLGSFFGATGTVTGAAIGSVVTTIGATLYQRSLDRTSETVRERIKVVGRGGRTAVVSRAVAEAPGEVTMPMPRVSPEGPVDRRPSAGAPDTVLLAPPATPARRRRPLVLAGLTVLVFLIAMFAVTGFEWIKGSTLTGGESGTSVGRVLEPGPAPVDDAPAEPADDDPSGEEAGDETTPTEEPDATEEPGTGEDGTSSVEPTTPAPDGEPAEPSGDLLDEVTPQ